MKRAFLKSLAALGVVACASSAFGATITLTPRFVGYTTAAQSVNPGPLPPVVTTTSFATPPSAADQAPANKYWFAVDMNFQGVAGEDFRSILYNIILPSDSIDPIGDGVDTNPIFTLLNRQGNAGATYYGNNANLSGQPVGTSSQSNTVPGAGGGYSNVFPNQPDAQSALDNQSGEAAPYTLGYFSVQLLDSDDPNRTITLTETNGNNFTYFTANDGSNSDNFTTTRNTFVGNSYTFPSFGSVPEPTCLGLLSLGGLLAVRRRRA